MKDELMRTYKIDDMVELETTEAFKLAEQHTKSKSQHINAYWLRENGYFKQRIQRQGVRKTYYIKMK